MTLIGNARLCSLRTIGVVAVVAIASTGCGGSDSESSDGESSDQDTVSAVLEIITTNIESSVGSGEFEEATAGQELVAGDRVKTDTTGFAEVNYHDGSWQRIENDATLTIEDLVDSGDSQVVSTSVDVGRTWNRVQELTEPEDVYELETPVATATVRGTAFSTECPSADECTFTAVEGTVEIKLPDGTVIELTAPETITIVVDEPPGEPEPLTDDELAEDPWIARNLAIDAGEDDPGPGDTTGTEGAEGADATAESVWSVDATMTIVAANPEAAGAELDYQTGDTVEDNLLLQGICDGVGPCKTSGSSVILAPLEGLELEPTGTGYSASWEGSACGSGSPTTLQLAFEIDGDQVTGTYTNPPGSGCFTDTEATFTGTLNRVS